MKTKITVAIGAAIVTCLSFTFVNVSEHSGSRQETAKMQELSHDTSPVGGLIADEVVR